MVNLVLMKRRLHGEKKEYEGKTQQLYITLMQTNPLSNRTPYQTICNVSWLQPHHQTTPSARPHANTSAGC